MKLTVVYEQETCIIRVTFPSPYQESNNGKTLISQILPVAQEHCCTRILIDMRRRELVSSKISSYLAGSKCEELGFSKKFKAAVLYARNEQAYQAFETFVRRRGCVIRVFKDEQLALAWLLDPLQG